MRSPVLALALVLLLPTARALAQPAPPPPSGARTLRAVRTDAPPVVDGRLDDAPWASAPAGSGFVQQRPRPGAAATLDAEVRVLYDDQALYVAVRNHDPRPDSVVARLTRRDQTVYSDWFTVLVDSYHDRRTAFAFAVNPRGVQRDHMIVEDGQADPGWDAVWEAAAAVDDGGWTAELRIPLAQLRFDPTGGPQTWGVNFARTVARLDELSYWSPVAPDVAGLVSQFGELAGLRDLRPPRRLELLPYTVARATRAPGERADPFFSPTELRGSAGLDLRYGLSSDLTLSATINPDFGQVEADPSEVNLTAFESFFDEKRPFFTEGADLFSLGFPQLVYSRRIGAPPRGGVSPQADFAELPQQTSILGAVKLTGKTAGGWSVGVLDAVTARETAPWVDTSGAGATGRDVVEPATNYLAARVRRDFRRGASSVGAIVTAVNRRAEPGLVDLAAASAYVGGVDARHRLAGDRYEIAGNALVSRVSGTAAAIARVQRSAVRSFQRPDAGHVALDPTRTSLAGYSARLGARKVAGSWRWDVGALALSPGFEANDLGFVAIADELRQHAVLSYQRFEPGRTFRSWLVEGGQSNEWTFGGERMEGSYYLGVRAQLLNHWTGVLRAERWDAALDVGALRGGPALRRPAGQSLFMLVESDPRRPVRAELQGEWSRAERGEGSTMQLHPSLAVRASERAELSLGASAVWHREPAQYVGTFAHDDRRSYLVGALDQATTSLTVRLDYTFAPTLSLQLYAEPFLSAGRYAAFRRVRDPHARRFADRYHTLGAGELTTVRDGGDVRHTATLDDAGARATFADPTFDVARFNANAVLRWEYRPGSSLYVVWSQGRSHTGTDGRHDPARDLGTLFAAPGTNTLLVKASYWLGL